MLQSGGLLGERKNALAERMLNTELDVHVDAEAELQAGNHCNGRSQKTMVSEDGELVLPIPCDCHGRFDPALVWKYRHRFPGFVSGTDKRPLIGNLFCPFMSVTVCRLSRVMGKLQILRHLTGVLNTRIGNGGEQVG